MRGYNEIVSDEAMQSLLDRMHGFHDGMTREVHLLNTGFVESDDTMAMNHRFDLRMVVQTHGSPTLSNSSSWAFRMWS